jgi:glucose/arabinose dehydrogenase
MAGTRATLIAAAAAAALAAAGCGGATSGSGSGTGTPHTAASQPPSQNTTTETLESATVVGSGSQLKAYLTGLAPMRKQIVLANRAAAHEANIASSGDYPALAADSRSVATYLGRAAAAARRMHVAQGLERPHADLVRSLVVGRRMASRLAALYEHIGPGSPAEYRHHVRPLEKLSLRLGNRWYGFMQGAMAAENIREPGWVGHLYDWT